MAKLGTSFTGGQLAAEVNDKVSSTEDNIFTGDNVFEGKVITDKIYANDDSNTEAISIDAANKTIGIFGKTIGKVKKQGSIKCKTRAELSNTIVGGSRIVEIPNGCVGGICIEIAQSSSYCYQRIQHFGDIDTLSFAITFGREPNAYVWGKTDSTGKPLDTKAYIEVDSVTNKTYFCIINPGTNFTDSGGNYELYWEVW